MSEFRFYVDDSGTRHPDKKSGQPTGHPDWFALGGIIIHKDDELPAREAYEEFCGRWEITYPLHSSEIRHRTGNFGWLQDRSKEREFVASLSDFLLSLPVTGHACVIDRPGYNARYKEKYGRDRWSLCKTAFSIAVERASKYARSRGARLRVLVERSSRQDEAALKGYYEALRTTGSPFNPHTSSKYSPLEPVTLKETLAEFRVKFKSSPMMQVADLYLYPICQGGYNATSMPYRMLVERSRIIDCLVAEEDLKVKYSCFDDCSYISPQNTKAR